jgi:hypothetical protein
MSLFLTLLCIIATDAQIYDPPMPDPLRRKAGMNMKWHFYKGNPNGNPGSASYNDSGTGWSLVNIPHSCSYDSAPVVVTGEADWAAESNYYKGNCWYRKTFGVPSGTKKLFIEFEGAMQVATVYVNGAQVGQHSTSGYTPFYFDISNYLKRGDNNVVAVRLNNAVNNDIPPGSSNSRPDFLLYSGLYRSVWLHAKDSVYIPIYSQHVQTVDVSASSARIRAITPVKNGTASAKTITVDVTLFDAVKENVVTTSSTQSIPANTTDTIDITTGTFTPKLWSPSSPYLYSVQTLVSIDGVVVDSVVEPCGVRWITWNTGPGGYFSLNGSRLQIKGMCVHQFQGWMENAVPDSRFYQEVKLLKNMGCNSIRCSHYPRPQAFYDACDRLGMLVYVEIPTWGWGYTPTATCWARMDSCVQEMVVAGRNHPCIYLWGLYNEPRTDGNFAPQITPLNATAHRFDSTRFTCVANAFGTANNAARVPDVQGLNYVSSGDAGAYRWINTEARSGFYYASYRGSPIDLDTTYPSTRTSTKGAGAFEWDSTQMPFSIATTGQMAGAHFWCFKDYNSPCNTNGNEGVVDRLTVPKTIFYLFRKFWTGAAPDYPRPGTATRIELECDTTTLRANETDIFLLTASMRDANGHLISSATGKVTFTVNPSTAGSIFGGNAVPAYAGRAGAFFRTSTIPATAITVTASYPGIATSADITLSTVRDTNQVPPYSVTALKTTAFSGTTERYRLTTALTAKGLVFRCPPEKGRLTVVTFSGKTLLSRDVKQSASVSINRRTLGTGVLIAVWEGAARRICSRINMVQHR